MNTPMSMFYRILITRAFLRAQNAHSQNQLNDVLSGSFFFFFDIVPPVNNLTSCLWVYDDFGIQICKSPVKFMMTNLALITSQPPIVFVFR